MGQFAVNEIGRLLLGLAGAALLAVALAAYGDASTHGPYVQAFLHRLVGYANGHFGSSLITGSDALDEVRRHLPATAMLVAGGALLAVVVGVPLALMFHFDSIRHFAAPVMQVIAAMPVFCAGLLLIYGAAWLLGWDAGSGMIVGFSDGDWRGMVLPIVTVGLAGTAAVEFVWRRTSATESDAPWRGGQKRLGLGTLEIEGVYVLPRMLAGLIAGAGEIVLALLSASVVAERVFAVPGAAELFVKSLALNDWNMAALVLFSFAVLVFTVGFFGRMLAYLIVGERVTP